MSTSLFLALLEIYKNGGMYVDLTTFFVRPIPRDLDGFVAGGQTASIEGATVGGDMAIERGFATRRRQSRRLLDTDR